MKRGILIALAALGMSSTASAQDDVSVIVGNLPNALTTLTDGLANVGDTFSTTQSFEATHLALRNEIKATGVALVEGAPTLGALATQNGYPIHVATQPGYKVGQIAMRVLDDPSVEGFQANVLGADDLNAIASNLAETPDGIYQTYLTDTGSYEIPVDTFAPLVLEPLLNEGSWLGLIEHIDGGRTPNLYGSALEYGLLYKTSLGNTRLGSNTNNLIWITRAAAFNALLGEDIIGTPDAYHALNEVTQPLLQDTLVPTANQSVLGQPSLAEAAYDLQTEPTFALLGYYDLVGADRDPYRPIDPRVDY